ncbi:5-(carboxyamino)imidazole ribonucleotide mutase [Gudongella sp. DL1XJH-153]|uniref:5-(carboxyamino)imidazole ribonucleotide mutase n=1 Tax=Gudongella sp. DL1XJH-153 TaxID=3409804 RepID=UPI003BB569CA
MKASIIMGSISDKTIGDKVTKILDEFGVQYELRVISAHRTPYVAKDFAENAEENGTEVIVAIAGKAAHLAGVLAGISPLPVIGIPAKSSTMDGLDSLLSVVQMPKGVPVATVAIDGGENGGLLAVQMLSIKYPELRKKFKEYKEKMAQDTIAADQQLKG